MNYVDHIVRNGVLAGTATVTLSTGTAQDLYPLSNLYNGRPGIPFRGSVQSIIDVDLGAAIAVKEVYLLATNIANITGTGARLHACNAGPPPVTDRGFASSLGALDPVSDFYGTVFLYPYKWTFSATCRYFRFTISSGKMATPPGVTPHIQVGEIWIEPSGDHAWFDDSNIETLFPSREAWSGRSDPIIEHERQARPRVFLRGQEAQHRADTAGAATLWERMFESQPLTRIDPDGYFGQRRRFGGLREEANRTWYATEFGESVIKTFDGDGKI